MRLHRKCISSRSNMLLSLPRPQWERAWNSSWGHTKCDRVSTVSKSTLLLKNIQTHHWRFQRSLPCRYVALVCSNKGLLQTRTKIQIALWVPDNWHFGFGSNVEPNFGFQPQPSLTLLLCVINRQTSAESSASGNVSSGQHPVYEAICGKTGGSDAAVLHKLITVL